MANTLSRFSKRSHTKEKMTRNENIQILLYLQTLLTKVSLLGISL